MLLIITISVVQAQHRNISNSTLQDIIFFLSILTMKRTAVIKGLLFALLSSSLLTECDGAVLSRPTNEGFRINQVPYGTSSQNGPAALAAVYTKRGFQAPEYVQRAVSRAVQLGSDDASSGSVPALSQNVYDVAYKCPVTLGSSQVYLDFDSGSSDL